MIFMQNFNRYRFRIFIMIKITKKEGFQIYYKNIHTFSFLGGVGIERLQYLRLLRELDKGLCFVIKFYNKNSFKNYIFYSDEEESSFCYIR